MSVCVSPFFAVVQVQVSEPGRTVFVNVPLVELLHGRSPQMPHPRMLWTWPALPGWPAGTPGDTVPPDLDERLESARRDRNVCTATLAMARDEIAAANAEQPTRLSGEVTPWPPQGPATVDRGPFQCTAP